MQYLAHDKSSLNICSDTEQIFCGYFVRLNNIMKKKTEAKSQRQKLERWLPGAGRSRLGGVIV